MRDVMVYAVFPGIPLRNASLGGRPHPGPAPDVPRDAPWRAACRRSPCAMARGKETNSLHRRPTPGVRDGYREKQGKLRGASARSAAMARRGGSPGSPVPWKQRVSAAGWTRVHGTPGTRRRLKGQGTTLESSRCRRQGVPPRPGDVPQTPWKRSRMNAGPGFQRPFRRACETFHTMLAGPETRL